MPASQNDPAVANQPLASEHTSTFPQLLGQFGISLLVTTYQAGRLIVVRNDNVVPDAALASQTAAKVQVSYTAVHG